MRGCILPLGRAALRAVALIAAFGLPLADALAAGSPIVTLKPSPRRRADPPMRILRVTSSDPACASDCPEWISAEGLITRGSAKAFAKVVADLGGRRLPVLISSHGGSVRDALEMGELIRAKRLPVVVARTLFKNCPERATDCPDVRGQAIADGAYCASACPLILAGGVERLVGPAPLIGVHQITTVVKEAEGVEGLTKTVKIYQLGWVDRTVEDYLARMGVGEPVMTLLRKTPAASIRWLSLDEIKAAGLATAALDAAHPILSDGANGLDGRRFDGAAEPLLLTGKVPGPKGSGAALALAYRRGGGALEVSLTEPRPAPPPAGWMLGPAGSEPLALKGTRDGAASALLPRARFCALWRDRVVVATPAAPHGRAPVAFQLGNATGVDAILGEACP